MISWGKRDKAIKIWSKIFLTIIYSSNQRKIRKEPFVIIEAPLKNLIKGK